MRNDTYTFMQKKILGFNYRITEDKDYDIDSLTVIHESRIPMSTNPYTMEEVKKLRERD